MLKLIVHCRDNSGIAVSGSSNGRWAHYVKASIQGVHTDIWQYGGLVINPVVESPSQSRS